VNEERPAFDMAAATAWTDANAHRISERPTEITIAVVEGVGPCYRADSGPSWFAYLATAKLPGWDDVTERGYITECDHGHPTEDDAWECAAALAQNLAASIMESRRG
jgi:hypothetical protein